MATIEQLQKQLAAAQQRSSTIQGNASKNANQNYINNLKGQIQTTVGQQKQAIPVKKPITTLNANVDNTEGTVGSSSVVGSSNKVGKTQVEEDPAVVGSQPTSQSLQPVDLTKDLQAWKQQQLQMQQNKLSTRYNQLVSDVNAKKSQVAPTYDAKRLQEQTGSQLQAKNFAEFMANRGLSRSGTSAQAELMRNMQLQQTYNALNKQQEDEMNYYQKQLDDAQRSYNSDLASAEQGIESDFLVRMMSEKARQDQARMAEAIRQEEKARQAKFDEINLLSSQYNLDSKKRDDAINSFNTSIAGYGADYNYDKDIEALRNDGDPTNDWQIGLLQAQKKKAGDEQSKQLKEYYKELGYAYNPLTGEFEANYTKKKDDNEMQFKLDEAFQKASGMMPNKYSQYEITPEIASQINPYYSDLAGEIQKRRQSEDTTDDALIPYLQNARYGKLEQMSPEQRLQYGQEFLSQDGLKNYYDIEKTQADIKLMNIDQLIKSKEYEYLDDTQKTKLAKAKEELIKAQTENKFLPKKLQAEIDDTIASVQTKYMNAESTRMNANTNASRLEFSKQNTLDAQDERAYKDIDNYIMDTYRTGTNYNEKTGTYKDAFTVKDKQDISAYLDNLAVQGTPVNIVKALKTKYGVK